MCTKSAAYVRTMESTDTRVDTGATGLGMPNWLISQLGLELVRKRQAHTTAGVTTP